MEILSDQSAPEAAAAAILATAGITVVPLGAAVTGVRLIVDDTDATAPAVMDVIPVIAGSAQPTDEDQQMRMALFEVSRRALVAAGWTYHESDIADEYGSFVAGQGGVPEQPPVGDREAVQCCCGPDRDGRPGGGYDLYAAEAEQPRPPGREGTQGLPVRSFLDLSTAHLRQETRANLSSYEGVVAYRTAHGWLVAADEDADPAEGDGWPAELLPIIGMARANGCEYILFDADGPETEALPAFGEKQTPHAGERPPPDRPPARPGPCAGRAVLGASSRS